MSFSKTLGPLVISENGGVALVSIKQDAKVGGGDVSGFIGASIEAHVQVDAKMIVDAGIELLAHKFPMFSGEIAALKALVDAEISKA